MYKGELTELDPRGLIYEAYRIEGITGPDCRTIFLDWALGLGAEVDTDAALRDVLAHYSAAHPDHPMTVVLREGLGTATRKLRGGRAGRTG